MAMVAPTPWREPVNDHVSGPGLNDLNFVEVSQIR